MFETLLLQFRYGINWIEVARRAKINRASFSKHFNGHQPISRKHYAQIFRAILSITGAMKFDGRLWMETPEGTICWLSSENWDDQDNRGIEDAHDLTVYLGG